MYLKKKDLFRHFVMTLFCLALCACAFTPIFFSGAYYPAIAHDPINGRYLAVYLKIKIGHPDAGGKGDSRLFGSFIDSSGSQFGNEFVIAGDPAYYYCPAIAFDSTHRQYLVIWNSEDNIFGQFINSEGSLTGARLTLSNTATTPYGRCSAVTYGDAVQKFVAAWGEQDSSHRDNVYARVINSDGSFDGSKLAVSSDGALPISPSIANDGLSQRLLVVWESADNRQIKGRMIDPDGTFPGVEFPISSASGTFFNPTVTYNSVDARFLVSWEYTTDDSTYNIVGQLLNPDGSAYQSLIAISSPGRNANNHTLEYNPSANNYLILFSDYRLGTQLLYAQVVKSDGTLDTTISNDNILISYADYPHDRRSSVAFDSDTKRYFSIWQYGLTDDREAFPDIHGRLINADGSPAGDISVVSNGGVW